jgi:hypothetical protein
MARPEKKSGHLSKNITLTLYKALINSVMTYASPIWEYDFAADAQLVKLQRLQNIVLRVIENLVKGAH